jgi:putative transposase
VEDARTLKAFCSAAQGCRPLSATLGTRNICDGNPERIVQNHILIRLSKTLSVSDFIKELKRATSAWVKEKFPNLEEFYWQAGYGAFSVSPSHVDALKEYIRNQDQHHRKETFQNELRRLFRKYGIAFDERYLWD